MNPSRLPDLTKLVTALAQSHCIGTVGIVGSHARGEAGPRDDLDLFITVSLQRGEPFARAFAAAARCVVHLHDFHRVPWFHPHHLCVLWLNCQRLPACPCPRRATIRQKLGTGGDAFEVFALAESIPHFTPVDVPPHSRPGETALVVRPPSNVL